MKYVSYAWIGLRNLLALGIAIAIFDKAGNDFERIVFSLLVLIYLSIASLRLGLGTASSVALFSLGKELFNIRKLIKERGIPNTTLNPVFSEDEIAGMKKQSDNYQRELNRLFDQLRKKEKEEINAHHEAGKDKSSFEPSATLLHILKEWSTWITRRNHAIEDRDKMIKANLAVLNGASMEEVKEGCELHSFFVDRDEETDEHREEDMKKRKEYWKSSWDYILRNDYLSDFDMPSELEEADEEEAKIAEAEKKMNKELIELYIEMGFASVLFLVALWHLVKGLNLI